MIFFKLTVELEAWDCVMAKAREKNKVSFDETILFLSKFEKKHDMKKNSAPFILNTDICFH